MRSEPSVAAKLSPLSEREGEEVVGISLRRAAILPRPKELGLDSVRRDVEKQRAEVEMSWDIGFRESLAASELIPFAEVDVVEEILAADLTQRRERTDFRQSVAKRCPFAASAGFGPLDSNSLHNKHDRFKIAALRSNSSCNQPVGTGGRE